MAYFDLSRKESAESIASSSNKSPLEHQFVAWSATSEASSLLDKTFHVVTAKPICNLPTEFSKLLDFRTRLEARRGSINNDPATFVINEFGSRNGKGSRDLLLGGPVDTRSNPLHRFVIQYLDDLRMLADYSKTEEIVISVSYGSCLQEKLNRSIFAHARCKRLFVIALEEGTNFHIDGEFYPVMNIGDVAVIPLIPMRQLHLVSGSAIYVVFGVQKCRKNYNQVSMPGAVKLESLHYEGICTVNRKSSTGTNLPAIACPDCRRPTELVHAQSPKRSNSDPSVLVTVVCDEAECKTAIEIGLQTKIERKLILVTDAALITPSLLAVWPEQELVTAIRKYPNKRTLTDYYVPAGFVSPVLFQKSSSEKDTLYTLMRAIGCASISETQILLTDPTGTESVCVTPNKETFDLMMTELRDWNHPCHRQRRSPIRFIREWIEVYA